MECDLYVTVMSKAEKKKLPRRPGAETTNDGVISRGQEKNFAKISFGLALNLKYDKVSFTKPKVPVVSGSRPMGSVKCI